MKTCKKVLRAAIKLKRQKNGYPNFSELSKMSNLHPHDVDEACRILVDDGYMIYIYPVVNGEKQPLPCGISLTLYGYKPMERFSEKAFVYLKDHWIDILALIISILALLDSMDVISLPSVKN